ncbi:hypothetical protein Droror1_Dr00027972 [Drosera rotundifolia]
MSTGEVQGEFHDYHSPERGDGREREARDVLLGEIQLKMLVEEMQAVGKGLERVAGEFYLSEDDGPISEEFHKNLKVFLCSAETDVKSLALFYSAVGKNADTLIIYFGEDPVKCPFEQGDMSSVRSTSSFSFILLVVILLRRILIAVLVFQLGFSLKEPKLKMTMMTPAYMTQDHLQELIRIKLQAEEELRDVYEKPL